jgi:hypothetical protein
MVQERVSSGKIEEDTAAQARADWAQQSALPRVDKALKSSIRPATQAQAETVTNPQMPERKLQAPFDDPRGFLQRAIGEDNADKLLTHVRNAHDALDHIKNFQEATAELPATGQRGLRDLIAGNTKSTAPITRFGQTVARTDWRKVLNDSESMPDQEKTAAFRG